MFGRRYTGVKGVGRLAAHKLARRLEVTSVHLKSADRHATELTAVLDWDAIEAWETLDEMPDEVISARENPVRRDVGSGTTLTLSRLRRPWSAKERARFFEEVQAFQTPDFIHQPLPTTVVSEPVLFEHPVLRDTGSESAAGTEGNFDALLEGDFLAGEQYWEAIAEMANWVLEIRAGQDRGDVQFGIVPTSRTLRDNPRAAAYTTNVAHPEPRTRPILRRPHSCPRGTNHRKRSSRPANVGSQCEWNPSLLGGVLGSYPTATTIGYPLTRTTLSALGSWKCLGS